MTHPTPVVVLYRGEWQPGEVLAWWQPWPGDAWRACIRMRYTGQSDMQPWVVFDPAKILPVRIYEDDVDWWLPPATREPERGRAPAPAD